MQIKHLKERNAAYNVSAVNVFLIELSANEMFFHKMERMDGAHYSITIP